MDPQQIPQLVAEIAMADPRVRREDPVERRAQARMWAGVLAAVPYDFAVRAAQRHYAQSKWPILPADIAGEWQAVVRRRMEQHTEQTPAVDPDDELAYRRALQQQRTAVAAGQQPPNRIPELNAGVSPAVEALAAGIGQMPTYMPEQARRQLAAALPGYGSSLADYPERAIRCPVATCRAGERHSCRTPSGRAIRDSHPSRRDLWLTKSYA